MKKIAVLLTLTILAAACKRGEEQTATATSGFGGKTATVAQQPAVGTEVGSTMPEYSSMWLDGSRFDLAAKRDKVVLLNLWATWCGPCVYEMPELQRLHEEYAARGFEVIGVSVDESGAQSVKEFVDERNVTYPIALDPEGKLANILQTSVLPTTVLIDRNGKIVWKKLGAIFENDPELKKAIEETLQGSSDSPAPPTSSAG